MSDNPLVRALTLLVGSVPMLVFSGVGVVASLMRWRQAPRLSVLWCLLGSGLILASTIIAALTDSYMMLERSRQGGHDGQVMLWVLTPLAFICTLSHGVGVGLLIMSVFGTRMAIPGANGEGLIIRQAPRSIRLWLMSGSLFLYATSLCLPAIYNDRVFFGFECLIELPVALMYPAWWANPV